MSQKRLFHSDPKGSNKVFSKEIKSLVKRRKNNDVKSLIKNIPVSDLIDSHKVTLLHLASTYNNIELIKFLLNLNCDINAKNSSEQTPLLAAISSNQVEAVTVLLCNNADFLNEDTERILTFLLENKDTLSTKIIVDFLQKSKNCHVDLKAMAEVLVKTECPIEYVVRVQDSRLTSSMLKTKNCHIEVEDYFSVIQDVMRIFDLENLQVLWGAQNMGKHRKYALEQMTYWFRKPLSEWISVKPVLQKLSCWIIFDLDFKLFLEKIFLESGSRNIEIFLSRCKIDLQMKEKFNFDVLPIIFGSKYEGVVEIALGRSFNVSSRSLLGKRALHFAVEYKVSRNVVLLLDLGADCNAKDNYGNTPLYYTRDKKCAEILLSRGADLQITDNLGRTIFDKRIMHSLFWEPWYPILAQLALDQSYGRHIDQDILKKIYSKTVFGSLYTDYLQQVEIIMNYKITSSTKLSTIFTEKLNNVSHYVQSQTAIKNILDVFRQESFDPFYHDCVKFQLIKIFNVFRSQCQFAAIISQNVGIPIGFDHLVVNKIYNLLTYEEMLMLLKAYIINYMPMMN